MLTDEQIRIYLDEPLNPTERAALEQQIVADPAALRKILDHRRIDQGLHVLLGQPETHDRVKESVLAVLEGPPPEALRNLVLRDTQIDPTLVSRSNRAVVWSAIALAACIAFAALVLNHLNPAKTSQAQEFARLEEIQGPITVSRRVGAPISGTNQLALLPGDTVAVPKDGSATIHYPDGTTIHLSGDTNVTLNSASTAGNSVAMQSGDMSATVAAATTARPLLVSTPQGTVTTGQGEMQVNASSGSTQLNVNSGTAHMARPGMQQSTEVTAGHYIFSAPGSEFRPRPFPPRRPMQTNQQTNSQSTNNFRPQPNQNQGPQQNRPQQNFQPAPQSQRPGQNGPPMRRQRPLRPGQQNQ